MGLVFGEIQVVLGPGVWGNIGVVLGLGVHGNVGVETSWVWCSWKHNDSQEGRSSDSCSLALKLWHVRQWSNFVAMFAHNCSFPEVHLGRKKNILIF